MNLRPLGIVLTVALVVVTGGCGGGDGTSSASSATSAPSAALSTAASAPPRTTAWVDSLPVGPPPGVGYVIGHTYHSPDGVLVRLPRDRGLTSIARLGDGWLVTDDRYFEGTMGVLLLDAGGRLRELGTVAGSPVLDEDGARLRWITFSPSEVGPLDRSPTRLHVADVATGRIRSRVIDRSGDTLPAVPQPSMDRPAPPLPPGVRRSAVSRVMEDRRHVLLALVHGRRAAIVRGDSSSGEWELAVDWTPIERVYSVAFETVR